MPTSQTEVQSQAVELSAEAMETFCEDISGMFGAKITCGKLEAASETVEGLKNRFKNFVAVNCVKTDGSLEGTFQIIIDREGIFILAGLITMPEQMTSLLEKCVGPAKIEQNLKSGSLKDAEEAQDALAEAGNLFIGSWDRTFREGMEDHGHFVQSNTFIGQPWDNPEKTINLTKDEELLYVPYTMKIEPYPDFHCDVIFPLALFSKTEAKLKIEAEAKAKVEAEEKAKAEIEAKDKAEAEEKAKAEAEEKAKAETEEKAKAEAEEQTKAETEEKAKAEPEAEEKNEAENDKKESVTKEDSETAAETKSHDNDTDVPEEAVKQEEVTTIESDETEQEAVSESIQKMVQSPAHLPGEHTLPSLAICAKDIMQKDVVWGNPDESVQQALTKMQQADSGYMIAGTDGVIEGIVSKSDITGAISPYLRPLFAKWRRPLDDATLQIKIKWIMARPVRTIKPGTSLEAIMESMSQLGGRCMPVVDQQSKVQGLVTVFDIFKALLQYTSNVSTTGKTNQAPPLV